MSIWKSNSVDALKITEFCSLAIWLKGNENFKNKTLVITEYKKTVHDAVETLTSSTTGSASRVMFPISVAALAALGSKAEGS